MIILTTWNVIIFAVYCVVLCNVIKEKTLIIIELTTTITFIFFYSLLLLQLIKIIEPIISSAARSLPIFTVFFIHILSNEFYLSLFFLTLLLLSPSTYEIICHYFGKTAHLHGLRDIIQKLKWLLPCSWLILWVMLTLTILPFAIPPETTLPFTEIVAWIRISIAAFIPFAIALIVRYKIYKKTNQIKEKPQNGLEI